MSLLLALAVEPGQALPLADTTSAVRGLLATTVVLALVAGLGWLLRRGAIALPGRRAKTPVVVESIVPLGERRSLVIVAVEQRRLLIGLTPSSVSLVTELSASTAFSGALAERIAGAGPDGGAK